MAATALSRHLESRSAPEAEEAKTLLLHLRHAAADVQALIHDLDSGRPR